MKLDHLSASTIDSFATCPRRAYLNKGGGGEGLELAEESATVVGRAVHETLEKYHSVGLGKHSSLREMFLDIANSYSIYDFSRFKDMLKALEDYERANKPDTPTVGVEKNFEIEIGGYNVVGVIDRIDYLGNGVYKVIDYKTSFKVKNEWELASDTQLTLYSIAVQEMWKEGEFTALPKPKRVTCSLYYLRHYEVEYEYTEQDRQALREYIKYMGDHISSIEGEPKPRLNVYCRYCEHRGSCEAFNSELAANINKYSTESMTLDDLVEEYSQLKQVSKIIFSRLDDIEAVILAEMEKSGDSTLKLENGSVSAATKAMTRYDWASIRRDLKTWQDYTKFDTKEFNSKASDEEKRIVEMHSRTERSNPFLKISRKGN